MSHQAVIDAEAEHVYTHEDLDVGLVIIDNGTRLNIGPSAEGGGAERPMTRAGPKPGVLLC